MGVEEKEEGEEGKGKEEVVVVGLIRGKEPVSNGFRGFNF